MRCEGGTMRSGGNSDALLSLWSRGSEDAVMHLGKWKIGQKFEKVRVEVGKLLRMNVMNAKKIM